MDRRGFLTGVGAIGAATAGGLATKEGLARGARAEGLAKAAGASAVEPSARAAPQAPALSVGFLPGSAGLLDYAARGQAWPLEVSQMRWARWQPSFALPSFDSRVDVAIGTLHSARTPAAPELTRMIEVVAYFALDVSPHVAPFNAWRYDGAGVGKRVKQTSPLVFEAAMPDRVGLQVNYAFAREGVAPGIADTGMVYLPLGARDGPGTGIYVLASPSRTTGAAPDFTEYTFSGDLAAPLRRNTGSTPEFDFVTLTIAPISAWS